MSFVWVNARCMVVGRRGDVHYMPVYTPATAMKTVTRSATTTHKLPHGDPTDGSQALGYGTRLIMDGRIHTRTPPRTRNTLNHCPNAVGAVYRSLFGERQAPCASIAVEFACFSLHSSADPLAFCVLYQNEGPDPGAYEWGFGRTRWRASAELYMQVVCE
jgi:hypothetical protein